MPHEDVPEDLVEAVARALATEAADQWRFDQNPKVRFRYRRSARAVLSAVPEAGWVSAGWVSKDDCDMTHEADMAYIRDADAARDEARAQAEVLAEALLYYVRGEHLRDYTNGRDTTTVARDAVTAYRSSREPSDAT